MTPEFKEEIELEDTEAAQPKPWDPKAIRITSASFSVRQIIDMIADGDIDLAPEFQRLYVWKAVQRARLIESILLGIPLPAFYFNQDRDGKLQVVDGVQRLTTISRFVREHEPLEGMEYLQDLNGKSFAGLDPLHKRRLQQTQLHANVIEPTTPDDVKFDVFRRINTGGSPLTAQEIRHCMARERSRTLLRELVNLDIFHRATDNALRGEERMADREMALRFCAFTLRGIDDYRSHSGLDAFLLDVSREIDGVHTTRYASEAQVIALREGFERAMRSALTVFGNTAFRKYPPNAAKRGPVNRALFESWSVALSSYDASVLGPHKDEIARRARDLFLDKSYMDAISQGTGDSAKVHRRFEAARTILSEVVI